MASSKKSGGGTIGSVISALIVMSLVVAFFRIPPHNSVDGTMDFFESRSTTLQAWFHSWPDNPAQAIIDQLINGGSGSTGGIPSLEDAANTDPDTGGTIEAGSGSSGTGTTVDPSTVPELAALTIAAPNKVKYDRDEWDHWDSDGCWNVREEVLARQSNPEALVLLDKNKAPTSDKSAACYVESGSWADPYTGKNFTNPSDLDIDHMIPLGYAARHGGQEWGGDKKAEYANSLDAGHLLAVSASANRSKSDRGPGDWQPQNEAFKCDYAQNWVSVSVKWGLTTAKKDHERLADMLATC